MASPDQSFSKNNIVLGKKLISIEMANTAKLYLRAMEKNSKSSLARFSLKTDVYPIHSDPFMDTLLQYLRPKIELLAGVNFNVQNSRTHRDPLIEIVQKNQQQGYGEIGCILCLGHRDLNENHNHELIINNKILKLNPGDGIIYPGMETKIYSKLILTAKNSWHAQFQLTYESLNDTESAINIVKEKSSCYEVRK